MADATAAFFASLSTRGREPFLGRMRATVRFDVVEGERRTDHWLVGIRDGVIDVAHSDGEADCVLRAEKAAFDDIAAGRTNAMAALLRGALEIDGDPQLLVRVQRLFPAPMGMPKTAGDRSVGRRRS
jgi:putative sterol carrier protein